jgi:hypothetical protein
MVRKRCVLRRLRHPLHGAQGPVLQGHERLSSRIQKGGLGGSPAHSLSFACTLGGAFGGAFCRAQC